MTFIARDAAPFHRGPFGDTLRWIAGEDVTASAWSLHERTAPAGARSTPHVHHHLTEAFYVLDGRATFTIDGTDFDAAAGDFAIARPGSSHGWAVSAGPARMLILFSPSAKLAFFAELHDLVVSSPHGRPDPAAYLDLAERYGWT
jgi:uncharacterized RmlC-like cupin family protein